MMAVWSRRRDLLATINLGRAHAAKQGRSHLPAACLQSSTSTSASTSLTPFTLPQTAIQALHSTVSTPAPPYHSELLCSPKFEANNCKHGRLQGLPRNAGVPMPRIRARPMAIHGLWPGGPGPCLTAPSLPPGAVSGKGCQDSGAILTQQRPIRKPRWPSSPNLAQCCQV